MNIKIFYFNTNAKISQPSIIQKARVAFMHKIYYRWHREIEFDDMVNDFLGKLANFPEFPAGFRNQVRTNCDVLKKESRHKISELSAVGFDDFLINLDFIFDLDGSLEAQFIELFRQTILDYGYRAHSNEFLAESLFQIILRENRRQNRLPLDQRNYNRAQAVYRRIFDYYQQGRAKLSAIPGIITSLSKPSEIETLNDPNFVFWYYMFPDFPWKYFIINDIRPDAGLSFNTTYRFYGDNDYGYTLCHLVCAFGTSQDLITCLKDPNFRLIPYRINPKITKKQRVRLLRQLKRARISLKN